MLSSENDFLRTEKVTLRKELQSLQEQVMFSKYVSFKYNDEVSR